MRKKSLESGKLNTIGASQVDTQIYWPLLSKDLKEPAGCILCKCELTV